MEVTMNMSVQTEKSKQIVIIPNFLNVPHVEDARFSHFPPLLVHCASKIANARVAT